MRCPGPLLLAIVLASTACDGGQDVCTQAAQHVADCLGASPAPDSQCNAEAAEAVLDLPCTELTGGGDRADDGGRVAESLCELGALRFCPAVACEQPSSVPADAQCGDYIALNGCRSCSYYACREQRANPGCGDDGYYIEFGQRYCERLLLTTHPRLSRQGQIWMEDARRCLMEFIEAEIADDVGSADSCTELRQAALESHATCYRDTGFCDLPPSDWLLLLSTVEPEDLNLTTVLRTGLGCLKDPGGAG